MESDWERRAPQLCADLHAVAERVARVLPHARATSARALSGGLCNTNLAVQLADGRQVVLRLYQRDPAACRREAALLRRLAGRVPVPALLGSACDDDPPWLLLALCPGQRLCDVSIASASELGEEIGRALLAIHGVVFPRAGFLGPDLQVATPHEPGGYRRYLEAALANRAGARLGPETTARLRAWIAARDGLFAAEERRAGLVHSDFKPTNLLVDQAHGAWRLSAVLDWEFAFAGPGLLDVGQLFREEAALPPGFAEGFARGYPLPAGWRETAAALDLLNLVGGFLDDPEERPANQADARRLVEATLARWP